MDDASAKEVLAALAATINFGKKISSVLHTLGAQGRTVGSCDFVLIADGTTRVLAQLQELVQQGLNDSEGKPSMFSQAGLNYVKLAADEVCLVFLIFEGTSLEESVRDRDADLVTTAVKGTAKEEIEKRGVPVVVDELLLIKKMEDLALSDSKILINWVNDLTDRLDDLKNHLHLIQQVVSVHDLTKYLNGMKDLRIMADSYDRIQRSVRKTSMLSDYGRYPQGTRRRSASKSSDSENDSDSLDVRRPRRKRVTPKSSAETLRPRTFAACNRRRATVVDVSTPRSLSPVSVPNKQPDASVPIAPPNPCCGSSNPQVIEIPEPSPSPSPKNQPPEYSKNQHSVSVGPRMNTAASISSIPMFVGSPCLDEKSVLLQNDEKEVHEKDSDTSSVAIYETRSSDTTRSLSSSDGNRYIKEMKSIRWRFKRFFRSNKSLETELQKNLRDDNKYLSAYLLQGSKCREIPHSDIHSVEWTHIHTIIAQMKGNGWYETFTNLSSQEQRAYDEIMPEGAELLTLKIVKTNQRNAWVRMLVRLAGGSNDLPHFRDGRTILAIIREEELDDDSSSGCSSSSWESENERPSSRPLPPPPPPPFQQPFFRRPSPPPPPVGGFKSSFPPRPGLSCNPSHSGPYPSPPPSSGHGSQPARAVPRYIVPNIKPLVVPDTEHHAMHRPNAATFIPNQGPPGFKPALPAATPQNESDALFALTAYDSYTLRPSAPADDTRPIAWGCCSVTHEAESQASLRACVRSYAATGHDIISDKMRLTEEQALQVARLVDALNAHEGDGRFMWTLAELSFFNCVGEPVRQQWNSLHTAAMHVTAVRQPLENLNSLQVFEDIRRCFDAPVFPPVRFNGIPGLAPAPRLPRGPAEDSEGYDSDSSCSSGPGDAGLRRRHWRRWNKAIRIKLDPADKEVDVVKRLFMLWSGYA